MGEKEISRQLKRYREKHGLDVDAPVGRPSTRRDTFTSPDGRTKTGEQWCRHLKITSCAFRYRLRVYGPDHKRTYMTKARLRRIQLREKANPGRRAQARTSGNNKGSEEWQAMGNIERTTSIARQ